jgi:hypothetical protein
MAQIRHQVFAESIPATDHFFFAFFPIFFPILAALPTAPSTIGRIVCAIQL